MQKIRMENAGGGIGRNGKCVCHRHQVSEKRRIRKVYNKNSMLDLGVFEMEENMAASMVMPKY